MNGLLLIVRLGGERIALPAGEVESVVEIESITAVPRTAPHVAGLTALRSRVLTVIDPLVTVDPSRRQEGAREAVVVVRDGHPYALLVEGVEDVVDASGDSAPIAAQFAAGWARVALGAVEAEGDLLLLADVSALIAGPVPTALSA
jgi:purine-binding chemotaxis protein CheW